MLWLCIPAVSLIVAILALYERFPRVPRRFESALFASGWLCLVVAGVFCRDMTMIIVSLPIIFVPFGIAAVLWRSSASAWGRVSTIYYWAGVLSIMVGAVRFGFLAALIQMIDTNYFNYYRPVYIPPQPHVALEIIFWSVPTLLVGRGLSLSKEFGRIGIAVAVFFLLLLNPAILLVTAWLRPPLSM